MAAGVGGHTEGTSLFSTWLLAASVVTDLMAGAYLAALHRTGAAKARGAKRESMLATATTECG
jgi:hypothetical protein